MSWAAEELKGANLGDKRRNRRLVKVVECTIGGIAPKSMGKR
jgi:hypothetical protein